MTSTTPSEELKEVIETIFNPHQETLMNIVNSLSAKHRRQVDNFDVMNERAMVKAIENWSDRSGILIGEKPSYKDIPLNFIASFKSFFHWIDEKDQLKLAPLVKDLRIKFNPALKKPFYRGIADILTHITLPVTDKADTEINTKLNRLFEPQKQILLDTLQILPKPKQNLLSMQFVAMLEGWSQSDIPPIGDKAAFEGSNGDSFVAAFVAYYNTLPNESKATLNGLIFHLGRAFQAPAQANYTSLSEELEDSLAHICEHLDKLELPDQKIDRVK